jgi:hypothetical protein
VQDAQRLGVGLQDGYVEASQGEIVAFDQGGVGEGGAADGGDAGGQGDNGTLAHDGKGSFSVHGNAEGSP